MIISNTFLPVARDSYEIGWATSSLGMVVKRWSMVPCGRSGVGVGRAGVV